MAVDMFLIIEGVTGETQDKKYKGKGIDIDSWSLGMSQSGTMHRGGGGGAGKVSVSDISFTKQVDRSSPNLIIKCCKGEHYSSAKLIARKAGSNPLEYFVVEMTDVLVSSYSTGGSSGGDTVTESVTPNFRKFKITYTPQKLDGTPESGIDAEFNIAENG